MLATQAQPFAGAATPTILNALCLVSLKQSNSVGFGLQTHLQLSTATQALLFYSVPSHMLAVSKSRIGLRTLPALPTTSAFRQASSLSPHTGPRLRQAVIFSSLQALSPRHLCFKIDLVMLQHKACLLCCVARNEPSMAATQRAADDKEKSTSQLKRGSILMPTNSTPLMRGSNKRLRP